MWFKYLIIALLAINSLGTIALIGEERELMTKSGAVVHVISTTILIIGLIHFWH